MTTMFLVLMVALVLGVWAVFVRLGSLMDACARQANDSGQLYLRSEAATCDFVGCYIFESRGA